MAPLADWYSLTEQPPRARRRFTLLLSKLKYNFIDFLQSLMNFILPGRFAHAMESLRTIFKVKGDSKITMLSQERVSRAKKMMTPFVLRRRKDQVSDFHPEGGNSVGPSRIN
jgi:hypothetical protein